MLGLASVLKPASGPEPLGNHLGTWAAWAFTTAALAAISLASGEPVLSSSLIALKAPPIFL